MAKKKFYVVWNGLQPGIYLSWEECRKQVEGFTGARYQSFDSREEAEAAFVRGPLTLPATISPVQSQPAKKKKVDHKPVWDSISVDAACAGNPGDMEYQGVETSTGKVLFRQGPFPGGTNNIGEFLALVHALAMMKQQGDSRPVYSDSLTARKWVRVKATKTNLQPSGQNQKVFELMERALRWLKENEYPNKILTWDTENWGEIPADFGRK